jgi:ribose transport system ATP-binding protein
VVYEPRRPLDAVRAGVVLVPERRDLSVFEQRSVAENLSVASLERVRHRLRVDGRRERALARDDVDTYGIVAPDVRAPVATLSGGNQQKVVLARWLRRIPRLLLLDEPTAGVDVGARAELHRTLRSHVDGGASAVLVSSDAEELCALSDRVLVLHDGRLVEEVRAADLDPSDLERRIHLAATA